MSQALQPNEHGIAASNGYEYPPNVYEATGRAVGTQREVARWWADGMLPTHSTGSVGYSSGRRNGDDRMACILRSSTGNFKGYQFMDGSGLLKHYNHIEAIRTRSGLIIGDTECYARGWAFCSKPPCDYKLPLTTLKAKIKDKGLQVYDIIDVEQHDGGAIVEFECGETYVVGEVN